MQAITQKKFSYLWLNELTEQQRKIRAEKAFNIIRPVADKQISLLKKIERNINHDSLRFSYFYETVKSVWDNVDFVLSLGKGKNRKFAFYPARTVMENTFRLEFFSRQKKDVQEDIALKECLRICKRNYDHEIINRYPREAKKFKYHYNEFAKFGNFPTIEKVHEIKDLEPFPSLKKLTENSKIKGGIAWYYHYQTLAELTHGKYMHTVMLRNREGAEYRVSLMYVLIMCNDVLKNTDFHLRGATNKEVIIAIQTAESVVKKPLKKNS